MSYDNSFTSIKRDIQKETMDKFGKGVKEQPPLTTIDEVPSSKTKSKVAGAITGPSPRLSSREEERKEKLNQTQPVKLKEEQMLANEGEGRPQVRPKASGIQAPRSRASNIPGNVKAQKNAANMSVDLNMPQRLNTSAMGHHEKLTAAGLVNKTVGGIPPPTA